MADSNNHTIAQTLFRPFGFVSDGRIVFPIVTAAIYVVVAKLLPPFVVVPGIPWIQPVYALPAVAGLLGGPLGAVGVGLGYGLVAMTNGLSGLTTLTGISATVTIGYTAFGLWGSFPDLASRDGPGSRSLGALVEFIAVATAAILCGVPVLAWGLAIGGDRPFFVTVFVEFVTYMATTVVIGIPLISLLGPMFRERGVHPDLCSRSLPVWLPIVSVIWLASASVVSIGYRLFELVPDREFLIRDLGMLLILDNDTLFGRTGWKVQLVLGVMFLTAFLFGVSPVRVSKSA